MKDRKDFFDALVGGIRFAEAVERLLRNREGEPVLNVEVTADSITMKWVVPQKQRPTLHVVRKEAK